ncbi:MAG TPA: 23S rRNA pseudouridine(1911/1915/1917) synthase RluD [Steroidobacteraceae bacterium]|nr:23S rRNA pseudouridine(1911/1915/1917) synthase RluD [Steroidobacteraceae bacterium]
MSAEFQRIDLDVPPALAGQRLDAVLAQMLPEHSRTRIKGWIEAGRVRVGRLPCKPRDLVRAGAHIEVEIAARAPDPEVEAEAMALAVVYEDPEVRVIDKPAGLVVHPGAGNRSHTLQNALLGLDASAARLPRAGLIHRLDKDTSGLLVTARTPEAQTALTRQMAERTIARTYFAVCVGLMIGGGTIDAPIGRNRRDRLRMSVRGDGRAAITHYRVLERFRGHTYLRVELETGRTHQIRLHLAHHRHPLIGDPLYGGRFSRPRAASEALVAALRTFKRQALHAGQLAFDQPRTGKRLTFTAAPPADFQALLQALRSDARAGREA